MRGWRVHTLLGEGLRNVVSAPARSIIFGAIVASTVGALTWVEMDSTEGILALHHDFVEAGQNVWVASGTGLDGPACVSLASRSDVMAAGAATPADTTETNIASGTLFQALGVTPGVLLVWGAPSSAELWLAEGIAVGATAASELGLTKGSLLGVGGHDPVPVAPIEIGRRNPRAARWLLRPIIPTEVVNTCWIELTPPAAPTGEALLTHTFSVVAADLAVRPLMRTDEFTRDPLVELTRRPQRHAWLAAGGLLTLLSWLANWFRRGELSLYRILGTSRSGILLLIQLETTTTALCFGFLGFIWTAYAFEATTLPNLTWDQYTVALRTTASTVLVPIVLGPLTVLMIGAKESLLAQLKEG